MMFLTGGDFHFEVFSSLDCEKLKRDRIQNKTKAIKLNKTPKTSLGTFKEYYCYSAN